MVENKQKLGVTVEEFAEASREFAKLTPTLKQVSENIKEAMEEFRKYSLKNPIKHTHN